MLLRQTLPGKRRRLTVRLILLARITQLLSQQAGRSMGR